MIKLEHTVLASPEQMEFIIEGMRNPKNSWEKSDSGDCCMFRCMSDRGGCGGGDFDIGAADLKLMQNLSNAGPVHGKFMRMIPVYVRITAPLYWWKEMDTYKIGTVSNSCSTMHKIHAKEFTLEDFSCEHLNNAALSCLENTISYLNLHRDMFLEHNDKKYWHHMIQLLPSSYNQTRNVSLNYEVLAGIYKYRKNHKLDEWVEFCKWIETLPYSELIIRKSNEKEEEK